MLNQKFSATLQKSLPCIQRNTKLLLRTFIERIGKEFIKVITDRDLTIGPCLSLRICICNLTL